MRDVFSVHVFHLDSFDAFDGLINRFVWFMSTSGAPDMVPVWEKPT